jgi:hypothetical protein
VKTLDHHSAREAWKTEPYAVTTDFFFIIKMNQPQQQKKIRDIVQVLRSVLPDSEHLSIQLWHELDRLLVRSVVEHGRGGEAFVYNRTCILEKVLLIRLMMFLRNIESEHPLYRLSHIVNLGMYNVTETFKKILKFFQPDSEQAYKYTIYWFGSEEAAEKKIDKYTVYWFGSEEAADKESERAVIYNKILTFKEELINDFSIMDSCMAFYLMKHPQFSLSSLKNFNTMEMLVKNCFIDEALSCIRPTSLRRLAFIRLMETEWPSHVSRLFSIYLHPTDENIEDVITNVITNV